MSESELQKAIIDQAHAYGWRVHHDPPGEDSSGRWRTRVRGDAGFPDLVLARAGEVIIVECKRQHGRDRPGQREWQRALGSRIVRPSDLSAILARLASPPPDRGLTSQPRDG